MYYINDCSSELRFVLKVVFAPSLGRYVLFTGSCD